MEKDEMLEVAPDGKQEIVEGKEPLKKDPKKIKDKWKDLKKGLNNLESIMDLAAASQPEEQPHPLSLHPSFHRLEAYLHLHHCLLQA